MLTKPDNDNDSAPMLDNHDDRIQCLIMLMSASRTITAQCFV